MPARADDAGRLTEAQICELVGTSQQRRQTWVARGLLRKATVGGCSLRDALALAQLVRLVGLLGPTDGVAAWQQTRNELDQPFVASVLDVIFDLQLKEAVVVRERARVGDLIAHERPTRLVRLAERRAEITGAFSRLSDATNPSPSSSTPSVPSRRRGSR